MRTWFDIRIYILILLLWGCAKGDPLGVGTGVHKKSDIVGQPTEPPEYPDSSAVHEAAEKTARLLMDQMGDDGKFTYRFNLNPERMFKDKYNVLRHGGSIYALGQWYDLLTCAKARKEVRDKVEDGLRFLHHCCVAKVDTREDTEDGKSSATYAIGSFPELNGSGKPPVAKLGGTALGLVAYATGRAVKTDNLFSLDQLQSLGQFLLFMQKADGQFYSKFRLDTQTLDGDWNSLYYPGEAALGLLKLYAIDNDNRWMDGANKALLYLAKSREHKTDVPHDHWALIATAELLTHGENLSAEDKKAHLQHVRQLCVAIMSIQNTNPNTPGIRGAFDPFGKTTPAATRIEGLVAAYGILTSNTFEGAETDIRLTRQIAESISAGVAFLMNAQIKDGPHMGAIPRSIRPMTEIGDEAKKFNRRATEVRIDYLQHALSAFIGYLNIHHTFPL